MIVFERELLYCLFNYMKKLRRNRNRKDLGKTIYPEWTSEQITYVIKGLARWKKYKELYRELISPTFEEENPGVQGLTDGVNTTWMSARGRMFRISIRRAEDIKAERAIYLASFDNIPLAHQKERVKALVELFYKHGQRPVDRAKILKQIQEEMGEDKWVEALKKSGKSESTNQISNELGKEILSALKNK